MVILFCSFSSFPFSGVRVSSASLFCVFDASSASHCRYHSHFHLSLTHLTRTTAILNQTPPNLRILETDGGSSWNGHATVILRGRESGKVRGLDRGGSELGDGSMEVETALKGRNRYDHVSFFAPSLALYRVHDLFLCLGLCPCPSQSLSLTRIKTIKGQYANTFLTLTQGSRKTNGD